MELPGPHRLGKSDRIHAGDLVGKGVNGSRRLAGFMIRHRWCILYVTTRSVATPCSIGSANLLAVGDEQEFRTLEGLPQPGAIESEWMSRKARPTA
jgi:hypothetical protein